MIIGAHETFIGIKKTSVISAEPFSNYEHQENFLLILLNPVQDTYIQTGQDPPL